MSTVAAIATVVDAYRVCANDPDDLDIELLKAPLPPGTNIVDAATNFARAQYEDCYDDPPSSQSINVRDVNGELHTLTIIAERSVNFYLKMDEPGDSLLRAVALLLKEGYSGHAFWLQPYVTTYREVPAKRAGIRKGIVKVAEDCGSTRLGDIIRKGLEGEPT